MAFGVEVGSGVPGFGVFCGSETAVGNGFAGLLDGGAHFVAFAVVVDLAEDDGEVWLSDVFSESVDEINEAFFMCGGGLFGIGFTLMPKEASNFSGVAIFF